MRQRRQPRYTCTHCCCHLQQQGMAQMHFVGSHVSFAGKDLVDPEGTILRGTPQTTACNATKTRSLNMNEVLEGGVAFFWMKSVNCANSGRFLAPSLIGIDDSRGRIFSRNIVLFPVQDTRHKADKQQSSNLKVRVILRGKCTTSAKRGFFL